MSQDVILEDWEDVEWVDTEDVTPDKLDNFREWIVGPDMENIL